jgi:hypothetical protein
MCIFNENFVNQTCMGMKRSIKRRLIRAKITLNSTLQKILDINRSRKQLPYLDNPLQTQRELKEELRVLNKIAEKQALLIRLYEERLTQRGREQM